MQEADVKHNFFSEDFSFGYFANSREPEVGDYWNQMKAGETRRAVPKGHLKCNCCSCQLELQRETDSSVDVSEKLKYLEIRPNTGQN